MIVLPRALCLTASRRFVPAHQLSKNAASAPFHQANAHHFRAPSSFRSASQTALHMSPLQDIFSMPARVAVPAAGLISVLVSLTFLKYRGAIRRRIMQVREESWIFGAGVTMERVKEGGGMKSGAAFDNLSLLELNPEFTSKYESRGWSLMSLGDYMSSLRPKNLPSRFSVDDLPDLIKREIEAGLAAALLKALGPNMGRALLPAVGLGPIQRTARSLAADVATKWFMSPEGISESDDKGGIPISLMTVLAASDLNSRVNSGKGTAEDTAIEKMLEGEVTKRITLGDGENAEVEVTSGDSFADFISEKFVISRDFGSAIARMEAKLGFSAEAEVGHAKADLKLAQAHVLEYNGKDEGDQGKATDGFSYDPEDRRLADPVPINPRLFPDLHLGWGKALSSHTKREVLKMRLISVLLNRLGANYYKTVNGRDDLFTLHMSEDSDPITTPSEFVQALTDSGHDVEAVPTSHLTTFGVCLCVKEEDGSWSNIPLAVFLESGFEDKDGMMAPAMMPHSGLDMFISGPLAGTRADGTPSQLRIQHFVGIEGFCGWHSNDTPEVPFNQDVEACRRLKGAEAIRAARIAGLYANILNGLATELRLPFGGYGLTAVCNDSAALVQQCLYDESTIYPMTSVGRFMYRAMRYGQKFRDTLRMNDMEEEVKDLHAIIDAMQKIPSDLNAAPSNAASAAQRMLQTLQPEAPFILMNDSKRVMESILSEHEEEKMASEEKTLVTEVR